MFRKVSTWACLLLLLFYMTASSSSSPSPALSEISQPGSPRVWVVVAYCTGNLAWIHDFLGTGTNASVTVISKCDKEVVFQGALFRKLPNVGGCDHTYAHYMAHNVTLSTHAESDIVLFLKDNNNIHQLKTGKSRTLQEMIRIVSGKKGFACWQVPKPQYSAFHQTNLLLAFAWKSGNYKGVPIQRNSSHLGAWAEKVGLRLPQPITPVCYGGNFAVRASHIMANVELWHRVEQSLSTGPNLVEAHYMERSWASVLQVSTFEEIASEQERFPVPDRGAKWWYKGVLMHSTP